MRAFLGNLGDYAIGEALVNIIERLGQQEEATNPLSDEKKAELKERPIAELEGDFACAICQEPFDKDEQSTNTIVELPCVHFFHKECVMPWFELQSSCPMCRKGL